AYRPWHAHTVIMAHHCRLIVPLGCTARGRSPTAEAHGLGPCKCGFNSHRPHVGADPCSRTALAALTWPSSGGATPRPRPAGLRPPDPPPRWSRSRIPLILGVAMGRRGSVRLSRVGRFGWGLGSWRVGL